MLEKTITYKDLDGNDVRETYCFHLSKADLIEMKLMGIGVDETIILAIKNRDMKVLVPNFKDLLRNSIGRREGNKFVRHPNIAEEFFASEAYSEFFFDLMTRPEATVEFINGIMPAGFADSVAKVDLAEKAREVGIPEELIKQMQLEEEIKQEPEKMKGISSSKVVVDELVLGEQSVFPGAGIVSVTPVQEETDKSLKDRFLEASSAIIEKRDYEPTEPVFAEQPSETEGWIMKPVEKLTRSDLVSMPRDQFIELFGSNSRGWTKQVHVAAMMRGDVHGK